MAKDKGKKNIFYIFYASYLHFQSGTNEEVNENHFNDISSEIEMKYILSNLADNRL